MYFFPLVCIVFKMFQVNDVVAEFYLEVWKCHPEKYWRFFHVTSFQYVTQLLLPDLPPHYSSLSSPASLLLRDGAVWGSTLGACMLLSFILKTLLPKHIAVSYPLCLGVGSVSTRADFYAIFLSTTVSVSFFAPLFWHRLLCWICFFTYGQVAWDEKCFRFWRIWVLRMLTYTWWNILWVESKSKLEVDLCLTYTLYTYRPNRTQFFTLFIEHLHLVLIHHIKSGVGFFICDVILFYICFWLSD